MNDWVQLLVSGLLGALAGGLVSLLAASRIARGSELGRVQEEARQTLISTVTLYRARVEVDGATASWKSSMQKDYLSRDGAREFAESVERNLLHLRAKLAKDVRTHLVRLVGPVDADIARIAAPMPVAERSGEWEAVLYMHAANRVGASAVEDRGLLGKAREAQFINEFMSPVVDELDAMHITLDDARASYLRL